MARRVIHPLLRRELESQSIEDITNIQSLARFSSEQEFIIRLRATLIDGRGGPRQRFNVTTIQEPSNEDESISTTQELLASSTPLTN